MFRKYRNYDYACLSKKNFIISQLLTILSSAVYSAAAFTASFFLIRFLNPILGKFIAG